MKRFLPMLALMLALSGCATILQPIQNPVTPANFAVLEAGYFTVAAVATNYRRACLARVIPPSCRGVVIAVQPYAAKAQAAVLSARAFIRANDTISAISAIQLAVRAIEALRAAAITHGVMKP